MVARRLQRIWTSTDTRVARVQLLYPFLSKSVVVFAPQSEVDPMKRGIWWYNFLMLKSNYSERRGKLSELDRSFDLAFWQSQPPAARFASAWELVTHYANVKGLDVRQLRLQRSVENFQRQQR